MTNEKIQIDETGNYQSAISLNMERRHWRVLHDLATTYKVSESQLASVMVEEEMQQILAHGLEKSGMLCWLSNVKPAEKRRKLDIERAADRLIFLEEASTALIDYAGDLSCGVDKVTSALAFRIHELVHEIATECIPEN